MQLRRGLIVVQPVATGAPCDVGGQCGTASHKGTCAETKGLDESKGLGAYSFSGLVLGRAPKRRAS